MKMIKFAIPIVMLISIMIFAVSLLEEPSNYIIAKDNITMFSTGDKTVVSVNNNAKFTVDGKLYTARYSMDKRKALVYVDYQGGSWYKRSNGGTLWYVTASEKVKIAEEAERYTFAVSGGGVAYMTDCDYSNGSATLYLYDCNEKRAVKITDNVYIHGDVRLSPDGKTIGYTADFDIDTQEYTAYVKQAGKPAVSLGLNTVCIAVADEAEYVYYKNFNSHTEPTSFLFSLHVRKENGEIVELIPKKYIEDELSLSFNADCSQAVFNYDGQAYISRDGRQKEKIADYLLYGVVLPRNGAEEKLYSEYGGAVIYGVNDFSETNFISMDLDSIDYTDIILDLIYINKKYKASKIVSVGRSPFLTADGKYVIFQDEDNRLYKVKADKANADKTVLCDDAPAFAVSAGGDLIYYVNKRDELWCVKNDGDPVKISDNVYRNSLAMSDSSTKAFFLTDYIPGRKVGYSNYPGYGTLCYSDNGGAKIKVEGGGDVSSVFATSTNIFYYTKPSSYSYTSYTYDVYRSDGNEKFYKFHAKVFGAN